VFGAAVAANCTSAVAGAAPPPCTAAELSSVVSGVTAQAATFLEAHPDANDVLTQAGSQPPQTAKSTVRGFFLSHPDQFVQLQGIAQPLVGMRSRCNAGVSIGQVASLLDALQE
jgi:heme-binding protein